jgi:hypothetical protein
VSTLTDAAPPLQHHAQAAVSGVSTLTVLLLIGGALIVAVVAAAGFRQMRGHGQTRTATA